MHEIRPSLDECLGQFKVEGGIGGVALLSNSAGLEQYDPLGEWPRR